MSTEPAAAHSDTYERCARGQVDIILAEALDRLSRDQEDIAGLYKRVQFADVKIITLSEGEISNLHIGLKGTMNAIFLKDLADKTRRGLRGRVENGKSGGGITFGYDVVKRIDANGEYARGERVINEAQAGIVRRIFAEYLSGVSPRNIAARLNAEGIACPSGGTLQDSHLFSEVVSFSNCVELEQSVVDDDWSWLSVVAGPSTEPGADPCGEGEGGFGVGVLLALGLAF